MTPFKPLCPVPCAVVLVLVSLGGCDPNAEFGEDFVRKSIPERHRLILEYPLEQQVELYLKSMLENHPPDLGLTSVLATHGADLVPILRAKLEGENDDYNKLQLISIFFDMQVLGHYAVASDHGLMTFLVQQVAGMEHPAWKKIASRKITLIKEDAGLRPGGATP